MFRTLAGGVAAMWLALGAAGCGQTGGADPTPGPTPPPRAGAGQMCGGIAGIQCQSGLFCEMEPGVCRRVADASGVCRTKPEVCDARYQPVCGCDGRTYDNACKARAAGTSVASQGACPA